MIAIIITLLLAVPISYLWARGIDKMQEDHSDYNGHDFLDWDDNHTEGEI